MSSNKSRKDYSKLPTYLERLEEANKLEDNPEGLIIDLIIEDTLKQAFVISVLFIALDRTF
jgi:hypothetical protein